MLDGEQLEQVSEFKYLGYVLDEKGTDDAECSRKGVNGRKVAGAIKSLVNVKGQVWSALGSCMRVCCYLCYCIVARLWSGIRSIDLKFNVFRWTILGAC